MSNSNSNLNSKKLDEIYGEDYQEFLELIKENNIQRTPEGLKQAAETVGLPFVDSYLAYRSAEGLYEFFNYIKSKDPELATVFYDGAIMYFDKEKKRLDDFKNSPWGNYGNPDEKHQVWLDQHYGQLNKEREEFVENCKIETPAKSKPNPKDWKKVAVEKPKEEKHFQTAQEYIDYFNEQKQKGNFFGGTPLEQSQRHLGSELVVVQEVERSVDRELEVLYNYELSKFNSYSELPEKTKQKVQEQIQQLKPILMQALFGCSSLEDAKNKLEDAYFNSKEWNYYKEYHEFLNDAPIAGGTGIGSLSSQIYFWLDKGGEQAVYTCKADEEGNPDIHGLDKLRSLILPIEENINKIRDNYKKGIDLDITR